MIAMLVSFLVLAMIAAGLLVVVRAVIAATVRAAVTRQPREDDYYCPAPVCAPSRILANNAEHADTWKHPQTTEHIVRGKLAAQIRGELLKEKRRENLD